METTLGVGILKKAMRNILLLMVVDCQESHRGLRSVAGARLRGCLVKGEWAQLRSSRGVTVSKLCNNASAG